MAGTIKQKTPLSAKSSGNIFADLGFDSVQATNLAMRSELMIAIERWFKASKLTQAKAAKIAGITQPRFNLVLKGKVDELSIDALVNIASAVGLRLKLSSVQPRASLKRVA